MLEHQLKNIGLQDIQIKEVSVSFSSLTAKQLSFSIPIPQTISNTNTVNHHLSQAHSIRIESLNLTFENWDILQGKIATITINKPTIHIKETPEIPDIRHICKIISDSMDEIDALKNAEITNGTLIIWDFKPLKFSGRRINNGQINITISTTIPQGNKPFAMDLTLMKKNNDLNFNCKSPQFDFQNKSYTINFQNINLSMTNKTIKDNFISSMDATGQLIHFDVVGIGKLKKPVTLLAKISSKNSQFDFNVGVYPLSAKVKIPIASSYSPPPLLHIKGDYSPVKKQLISTLTSLPINVIEWIDLTDLIRINIPDLNLQSTQLQIQGNSTIRLTDILKAKGKVKWFDNLILKLSHINLYYSDIKLINAETQIVLSALTPVATKGESVLTFQTLMTPKGEFQQGHLIYSLKQNPLLHFPIPLLKSLNVETLDGKLTLSNFQYFDLKNIFKGLSFATNFDNINLQKLVESLKIPDLTVEGSASGTGLFSIDPKGIGVQEVALISSNGKIQYKTPKSMDPQAKIALKALKNFHYTLLNLSIYPETSDPLYYKSENSSEQNIQASIKISGSNPKLLNGHPFAFNIKTSGQLSSLINNLLNNLSEPQDLEEVQTMLNRYQRG